MLKKIPLSARNLLSARSLALAGMLIAMNAVLGAIKIPFALDNRITLTFAVNAVAGMVLGPVPAMVVGGLGDILGYFINPGGGAFFIGFTISAMLGGFIYGLCLYKRNAGAALWWTILAVLLITLFVNIILNTIWLSVMYKEAYQIFTSLRIAKNFVMLPVHVIVIYALFMLTERMGIKKKF